MFFHHEIYGRLCQILFPGAALPADAPSGTGAALLPEHTRQGGSWEPSLGLCLLVLLPSSRRPPGSPGSSLLSHRARHRAFV